MNYLQQVKGGGGYWQWDYVRDGGGRESTKMENHK